MVKIFINRSLSKVKTIRTFCLSVATSQLKSYYSHFSRQTYKDVKMKKFSLIFCGFLVVVLLIGPKLSGWMLTKYLDNLAQRLDDIPGYTASIDQIKNDWFSSQASLNIQFEFNELQNQQFTTDANTFAIKIPINAQHGPIIISPSFAFGLATFQSNISLQDRIEGLLINDEEQTIYSMSGIVNLVGTTIFSTKVPGLTFVEPDSLATYTQTEWTGEGVMGSDVMSFETTTALNASMQANDVKFLEVNGISLDYSAEVGLMQIYEQVLYDGQFSFVVDSIGFEHPETDEKIDVKNIALRMTTTFDEAQKKGNFSITNDVAIIKSGEFLLENMSVTYAINNVNQRFIKAYQTLADRMLSDPTHAQDNMQSFLAQELLPQLQANPELNISTLYASINESTIEGHLNSKLTGINVLPPTLEDPTFWMQHAEVDGNLQVQNQAAVFLAELLIKTQLSNNPQFNALSETQQQQIISQQATATLQNLVQSNVVAKTEDGYEVVLNLNEGSLSLNGTQIPL